MHVRSVVVLISVTTLSVFSGCGSKNVAPTGLQGEAGVVEDLVYRVTDIWNEKERFDGLFAESATLSDKERKKFAGISVRPDSVAIDGDTATMEVEVTTYVNYEAKSTTATWAAAKQADAWKLTKAPLR